MVNPLPAPVVAALQQARDSLNARFQARRLTGKLLDGAVLLDHVRARIAPILAQVHAVAPDRVGAALVTLYEVSLDLLESAWIGPSAKHHFVGDVWTHLLPAAAKWVAEDPLQAAGCPSNAICRLAGQRGVRPELWIERMRAAAPLCHSLAEWLDCGPVAAWQAGFVQLRAEALRIAARLPIPVAAAVLAAPDHLPDTRWSEALKRLSRQPWLTVASALTETPTPMRPVAVRVVGAFRGYDGEFLRPPLVRCERARLLATDGSATWRLYADAYGAWFGRTAPEAAPAVRGEAAVSLSKDGTVRWGAWTHRFPALENASSFAFDGTTLAVTSPTSHGITLVCGPELGR